MVFFDVTSALPQAGSRRIYVRSVVSKQQIFRQKSLKKASFFHFFAKIFVYFKKL